MRDVSTCPELSCGFVHASGPADSQSKPLPANTDSAPSVLPVPLSAASTTDVHQVSASQSVPGVGVAHVTFADVSAGHQVQRSLDTVSAGANRDDMSDSGGCRNVAATSTVVSCHLQMLSDVLASVVQPSLGHVTEAVTQLPQTAAAVDSAAVEQHGCTVTRSTVADVVASSGVKRFRDEAAESAVLPAASNFVYHEDNACDHHTMMDTVPSAMPAPSELQADSVCSASELGASNAMYTDQVPSNETVAGSTEILSVSESRNDPVFPAWLPAAGMPYMDEGVDLCDTSVTVVCTQPDSAHQSVITPVDEETSMSAAGCDELCHLSATVAGVGDRTTCCSGAVAGYRSNDESRSTMEDIHLVSILTCFTFCFTQCCTL